MFDFWPRPPERSYQELILEKMRPGDIHTHVFAQQFPVLDDAGKPNAFLHEAQGARRHLRPGPRRGQLLVPQRGSGHAERLLARLHQHGPAHAATSMAWSWTCTRP